MVNAYGLGDVIEVGDSGYVAWDGRYLNDADIVRIARVSTDGGNRTVKEDKPFLDYLFRHEHLSPFGFPQMTFKVKAPIFVVRQWYRHRMAQVNELSGRYTQMPDDMYLPSATRIQSQGTDNRQGSGEPLEDALAAEIRRSMSEEQTAAMEIYQDYLAKGVSKEVARINLPLAQYTIFYWQQDLRNLLHLLRLRMDSHAQPEIQEYAKAMYKFTKAAFPWTCEAFEKHVLEGRNFHRDEMEVLRAALDSEALWNFIEERTQAWKESHRREFFSKLWEEH